MISKRTKKLGSKILLGILLSFALFTFSPDANAQCPMCKGAAETSQQEGSDAANGINKGILYLFVMPYLLAGFIGYQWYRTKKKNEQG